MRRHKLKNQDEASSDSPGKPKWRRWLRRLWPKDQRGSIVVVTGFGLLTILGLIGLVVDLGNMYLVRGELQRAADAGAIAGARALFFPQAGSPPQCSQAINVGTQIAQLNLSSQAAPEISAIQTGHWDWNAKTFAQGCSSGSATFTDAVSLTTCRANVPLWIMGSFGFGPYTLQTTSIGVMDYVGSLLPGVLAIPVAVGKKWSGKGVDQGLKIYFNNENQDTGGWYAIPPDHVSTSYLRNRIANPISQTLSVGDMVDVNTGVHNAAVGDIDAFIGKTVWLPVLDTETFNGNFAIQGFIGFEVQGTGQDAGPDDGKGGGKKYMQGVIKALVETPSNQTGPGGPNYGLLTNVRLVQ